VSTKAKVAAFAASAGVLAAGWAVGTANGQTTTATDQGGTTTTQTTTGTTKAGTSATTKAAGTTGGSYKDGTFTGTTASHRYGSVTVTVKISGGKISDVTANVVDDGERRSQSINSQAIPMIKSSVLSANSAKVSTIGGATFTTTAYLSSLQSALGKAGG
jgi:uncharacterized protein with FMN-binding domain